MRQLKNASKIEDKLDSATRCKYLRDIKNIYNAQFQYFALQIKLYQKIWPFDYSAIPQKLLDRYQVVLKKLGNVNNLSLKQYITKTYYSIEAAREDIASQEAIADTLDFYTKEKGFTSYKQRNEIYNILEFASLRSAKYVVSLWKSLKGQDGYNLIPPKDIVEIIKYYKKSLRKR